MLCLHEKLPGKGHEYYTTFTVLWILHNIHCTLNTTQHSLYFEYYTAFTVLWILHNIHCTLKCQTFHRLLHCIYRIEKFCCTAYMVQLHIAYQHLFNGLSWMACSVSTRCWMLATHEISAARTRLGASLFPKISKTSSQNFTFSVSFKI